MHAIFETTRRQLRELGLPDGDHEPQTSQRTFGDGGHYRIEVPTINSARAAEHLLANGRERGLVINRVTETRGLFRHTASEVRRYADLHDEYGVEVLMSVGPRATYDIGAAVHTPEGGRIGYRLRGQEQIVRAVEDVKRAVDLGIRGLVVYDEGLLYVLSRLRAAGRLPADLRFKVSAHCGHGNAASARVLEELGADSVNPVRDLTLPMLGSIRAAISIPIDVHVDNPKSSGGFVRTYDAPEFVRIAAPVHLKAGNGVLDGHGLQPTLAQIDEVLAQVEIVSEFLDTHCPWAMQSSTAPAASDPG